MKTLTIHSSRHYSIDDSTKDTGLSGDNTCASSCGEKHIHCEGSGNMPRGDQNRVFPGGDKILVSPRVGNASMNFSLLQRRFRMANEIQT